MSKNKNRSPTVETPSWEVETDISISPFPKRIVLKGLTGAHVELHNVPKKVWACLEKRLKKGGRSLTKILGDNFIFKGEKSGANTHLRCVFNYKSKR